MTRGGLPVQPSFLGRITPVRASEQERKLHKNGLLRQKSFFMMAHIALPYLLPRYSRINNQN